MNKIILLGRLTKNPEIKYSQTNNIKVGYFTIAVNRKYVKQGEERQTDFINIVTYSKLAEFTEKYLKQGLQICICGRLQIRNWEDKNGQKRYISEVIAEDIDFADITEGVPAFITIAAMAFTYSIGDGLTLGVLSYVVINLLYNLIAPKEERKRISAVMVVLALLFVLKLIYL